jgi:neutral trehalase
VRTRHDGIRFLDDCRALAELRARIGRYAGLLQWLWDDDARFYVNRRTDTGAWSHRLSPTNFCPLLAGVPTDAQVARMVRERL